MARREGCEKVCSTVLVGEEDKKHSVLSYPLYGYSPREGAIDPKEPTDVVLLSGHDVKLLISKYVYTCGTMLTQPW